MEATTTTEELITIVDQAGESGTATLIAAGPHVSTVRLPWGMGIATIDTSTRKIIAQ